MNYRKPVLLVLLALLFLWGCDSNSFVFTTGQDQGSAPPVIALADFDGTPPPFPALPPVTTFGPVTLVVSFGDVVGGLIVDAPKPAEVETLRFNAFRRDGSEPLPSQESDVGSSTAPISIAVADFPLGNELFFQVEAIDAGGNPTHDYMAVIFLPEDADTFELRLLPIGKTKSAFFRFSPILLMQESLAQSIADQQESLLEENVRLFRLGAVYPTLDCTNWRFEVGGRTFLLEPGGYLEIGTDLLAGETEATLRHPTDDRFSATIQLSELVDGRIPQVGFILPMPFEGPCSMDARTRDSEFCGNGPLADFLIDDGVSSQEVNPAFPILPIPGYTANRCKQLIPKPTQIQFRARGSYPEPKDFFVKDREKLLAFTDQCEQTNGGLKTGDIVSATNRPTSTYLGSTCHAYVRVGCCPNENTTADLYQALESTAHLASITSAIQDAGIALAGLKQIYIGPFFKNPFVDLACPDNHKGRECQEVSIGDVSLDFRDSGKGSVQLPAARELVIDVGRNEQVRFVVHNNGCYGKTTIKATSREINGLLSRNHDEYAISPIVNVNDDKTPKLQVSTVPILRNSPTAGRYFVFPNPGYKLIEVTTGWGGSLTVDHFATDPQVGVGIGVRRFRYFPDITMNYSAVVRTAEANNGAKDRFVFDVDGCQVAVTFRLRGEVQ
jgi:hypothetical protein